MFKSRAILCLGAALSAPAAFAQVSLPTPNSDSEANNTGSPVAYVYLASTPAGSKTNEIVAYSAATNGALSPVAGSPFQDNVYSMAVNGKYLMAASVSAPDVNTYKIGSNGTLTYATATNYAQYNTNSCGGVNQIFFDHTGATLYLQEYYIDCANGGDASFAVVQSSGALTYLGNTITGAFPGDYTGTYFIGDNVYAYSADQSGCMYPAIYGFQRQSSGLLTVTNNFQSIRPTSPPGQGPYYPDLAVADPSNHLAIIEQPTNAPSCAAGPLQLAVYTADANGNLSTTSTYKNMPATLIVNPYDMKMSPSGKLLAVAGQEGLQIFHFRGANPIRHYTNLITTDPLNQMFWDNKNHLYAISSSTSRLYVFTITPTTNKMAPGSPYTISSPQAVIVQPLP